MLQANRAGRYQSLLLATGQSTSYGSGTGVDDGALKKGIVKSYTVLTAGQYASTVSITLNSKTDTHSNNCVFDNNTGLMWSRYHSATVGPTNNGKLPWTTTGSGSTAEGIFDFCAAANAASLGGYSDWRVANVHELESIIDWEAPTLAPDSSAFPSWVGAPMWSSTTAPTVTTSAMTLNYATGDRDRNVKTTTGQVALVRG